MDICCPLVSLNFCMHKQSISSVLKITSSMLFQHGAKTGCVGLPERAYVNLQHDSFPEYFEGTQFSRVLNFTLLESRPCVRCNATLYWDELLTWPVSFFPRIGTLGIYEPQCLELSLWKCPEGRFFFSSLGKCLNEKSGHLKLRKYMQNNKY